MYRHGELPTWNPYIFSGTPLLAGFNAGAFYPLVGLFVVLPDRAAWIATEVLVFSGVAVGMYVFLRAMALSTVACLLGAATFAFSGTVLSQVNHLDMTEGFVAIPWMLFAVLHIVREGRWRWSVLLGVAFASVILAGAPEAMLDEALLVIAFAALSAGFDAGRWWRVLSRCGAGALARAFPGRDPVAPGARGHFELPTGRERCGLRRARLVPVAVLRPFAGPLRQRGLRQPWRKRVTSPATTCPKWGSISGSCR